MTAACVCAACSTGYDDDWENYIPEGQGGGMTPGGGSSSSEMVSLGTLTSFSVDINTTSMSETEVIPTDENDAHYNDYIENNFEEKNTVGIAFNGTSDATVSGTVKGDTITVSGGHVEVHAHSKGMVLKVSGETTDGSLKIYSEKKFELLLNGTSITSTSGSAINIQDGNCFVVINGTNTLADSSSAAYTPSATTPEYASLVSAEDMKAVFFSEDDLRFSGSGTLTINAQNQKGKAGISSDDAIFIRPNTNLHITCGSGAGNAIKANDDICMRGGVVNTETAGSGSKGLSSDCLLEVEGGRLTAITTGGVDTSVANDYSGCAGIKADSVMTVSGGELYLKSTGQGGKGISCDDVINITGGQLRIITTGSQYGSSSSNNRGGWGPGQSSSSSDNSVSPKGIKGDANVNISGGDIMVRTSGSNAEGIESKATLTFSGGKTAVSAYDDGLNASTAINVSGDAYVFAISNGQGDGIDSNGSIKATGGVMIGVASTVGSEEGIDLENSTFSMSNATVISIGNSSMTMGANYSGHYISTSISGSAGSCFALTSGDKPVAVFALPRQYSGGRLLLSTPSMSSGSYTLSSGVTVNGGSQWMMLYEGVTSVSGGSSTSVTAK